MNNVGVDPSINDAKTSMFHLRAGSTQFLSKPNVNYYINTDVVEHSFIQEKNNKLFFDDELNCIKCVGATDGDIVLSITTAVNLERFPVRNDDAITVGLAVARKEGDVVEEKNISEVQQRLGFYTKYIFPLKIWRDSFEPFLVSALVKVDHRDTYIGCVVRAKQKGGKTSGYYQKKVIRCTLTARVMFQEPEKN